MGRIGRCEYPDLSAEQAAEAVRKISTDGLPIEGLGQDERDLLLYGLLERKGNRLVTTRLAHRLAQSRSSEEAASILAEMSLMVPFLRVLYERFGKNEGVKDEEFVATMAAMTFADPKEVRSHLAGIREHLGRIAGAAVRTSETATRESAIRPAREGLLSRVPRSSNRRRETVMMELSAPGVLHRFPFTVAGIEQLTCLLRDEKFIAYLRKLAAEDEIRISEGDV